MEEELNRQWRLAARPIGFVKDSDFKWHEDSIPIPKDGEVLIRNIYLSIDPANRGWLRDTKAFLPPVSIGEVMRGMTIGVVKQSLHPELKVGDMVQGLLGWQDYAVTNGAGLTRLPQDKSFPLTAYMGLLGTNGATAYFGLLDVGKPKAGETLVVSSAAGSVGSLVGQIGKIKGCRVVGIAGSEEKCRWITEALGFDAAINYKSEPVRQQLKTLCPEGISVYFDNVGGEMLDAVLSLINIRARIALCGLISQYNEEQPTPVAYNFRNIIAQRARIVGFVVNDYAGRFQEAMNTLKQWLLEGKIQYRVNVIKGLENGPNGLKMLFDGSSIGKLIIKISADPTLEE